ncbi:MAG: glycosyl transferase family 1 [Pseudomonadota bacterium]
MTQVIGNSDISAECRDANDTAGRAELGPRVAFFGHDIHDAAIRRRASAFVDDGLKVDGFMMRRGHNTDTAWLNIDLGETRDGAFVDRVRQIFRGARTAANSGHLQTADIIYARNLDMLACAFLAKRHLKLDTPVIYECLDVHRLLVRRDPIGAAMRWLEGRLLRRCKALVVSSPAFLREHFEPRYGLSVPSHLVENRMAEGMNYGERPTSFDDQSSTVPLRIGWFGVLRCSRSLDLLLAVADQFGDRVELNFRGRVSRCEVPDFEARIADRPNVSFGGAFKAPEDLGALYKSVDVVWAGDFMEAGYNSVWLLPNRLYEGGYFGVPPIAPAGTETARWIMSKQCGYQVAEPLHEALPKLIETLLEDRSDMIKKGHTLLDLPADVFIQPLGTMRRVITGALEWRGNAT